MIVIVSQPISTAKASAPIINKTANVVAPPMISNTKAATSTKNAMTAPSEKLVLEIATNGTVHLPVEKL